MDEINAFIDQFCADRIEYTRIGTTAFAGDVSHEKDMPLMYTSTRLGEFTGGGFKPSIPLVRWISERTERKVVVNEKTAWLFICKNNILKEGIISLAADSGSVIVVNQRDECLGYGDVTGAGVTNKLDIGDYLRRER